VSSELPLGPRDVVSAWGPFRQPFYVRCPRFVGGAVVFDRGQTLVVPDDYTVEVLVSETEQGERAWREVEAGGELDVVGFVWELLAQARQPHGVVGRPART
jgi:hypothetical protein